MLELKHLETSYGQSQVLFGVDLQVNEREVVTLLGRNGMGKTTTINSIMGLVRARSGEIKFEGSQIREWPAPSEFVWRRPCVFAYFSIYAMVLEQSGCV